MLGTPTVIIKYGGGIELAKWMKDFENWATVIDCAQTNLANWTFNVVFKAEVWELSIIFSRLATPTA